MEKLPKPKTHLTEVLYELITKNEASIEEFYWMSGFRTRISDLKLKHGLNLDVSHVKTISKHGNSASYCKHSLPENQREKAINIYKDLTKKRASGRVLSSSDIKDIQVLTGIINKKRLAFIYRCPVALIEKVQSQSKHKTHNNLQTT